MSQLLEAFGLPWPAPTMLRDAPRSSSDFSDSNQVRGGSDIPFRSLLSVCERMDLVHQRGHGA
jgi:hypothetical protein